MYCSGIGWTTYSYLNPELDISDRYDERLISKNFFGKITQSKVLGPPIRQGYDMCPYDSRVAEIVAREVSSIAAAGVDYAQYFDQNLGGESCFCYAKDHGHPEAPGVWQNEAMKRIFSRVYEELDKNGKKLIIGCEGAASEPFIGYLPFNDLRFNIGYKMAKPVPVYSYVFHEYLNNFMGNQNCVHLFVDLDKSPDNLLFRLAYAFAAGDMFTLTLCGGGRISWAWTTPWDVPPPEEEPVFELIKNLNGWRRAYRDYLALGKMVKPTELDASGEYVLHLKDGGKLVYPPLITTRWQSADGSERQLIVNHSQKPVLCRVNCSTVYDTPDSIGRPCPSQTAIEITIPPLSAVSVD